MSLKSKVKSLKSFLGASSEEFALWQDLHAGWDYTVRENPGSGRVKVVNDEGSLEFLRGGAGLFCPVASSNQDRLADAGIPAAFEIDQLVSDHVAARQVHPKFIPCIKQELGRRFAPAAGRIRMFRSDVDLLETNAIARQQRQHMRIYLFDIVQSEIAASDTRLVGDDEQLKAVLLQPPERRPRAGKERHLLRRTQIMPLFDQRPVAIQKNGWR